MLHYVYCIVHIVFIIILFVKMELLEASILWSHREETRELPGERDNAMNNARCTQGEEGHARPGWTTSRRGQDSPWKSQSEWQTTGINGESTSMVWPTLRSRTAKEQNRNCLENVARSCWVTKTKMKPYAGWNFNRGSRVRILWIYFFNSWILLNVKNAQWFLFWNSVL